MKRDLNDPWLRSQKPPETGRLGGWDTRVSGLVLRMTPGSVATWSVSARSRDVK